MSNLIQLRRDTEANWTANNPILAAGELALSTDTDPPKLKVGDGTNNWSTLTYITGTGGGGGLGDSFETVSKNLESWNFEIEYNIDDTVDVITYTSGLESVTKTFGYTGDKLTSITLAGDTPGGIDLTKTLSYTVDKLTSVSYS